MKAQGKLLALTSVALGLAVLVGAGIAAKDWIREEWWIHNLSSGDPLERIEAAQQLGDLRSRKAVPKLRERSREYNAISERAALGPPILLPSILEFMEHDACLEALAKIQRKAAGAGEAR